MKTLRKLQIYQLKQQHSVLISFANTSNKSQIFNMLINIKLFISLISSGMLITRYYPWIVNSASAEQLVFSYSSLDSPFNITLAYRKPNSELTSVMLNVTRSDGKTIQCDGVRKGSSATEMRWNCSKLEVRTILHLNESKYKCKNFFFVCTTL